MIKNILIFQAYSINPIKGGVARVYYNLTKGFIERGLNVFSLGVDDYTCDVYTGHFVLPDGISTSKLNCKYVESICRNFHIDVIINGYPNVGWTSKLIKGLKNNVFIISHYHNSPFSLNSSMRFLDYKPLTNWNWTKSFAFIFQKYHHYKENQLMMEVCDKMVLLSDSFKKEINNLIKFPENKLIAIPNPILPVNKDSILSDIQNKEKTLLYVGRVSEKQKRIHSLLNIWKLLYKRMPEWRLEIVGGGDELQYWKIQAAKMGMERYSFEGFRTPNDYYKKAQILLMTSNYEGFGMVLVEAMQYGCVPFAFRSYGALTDIIDDGVNGVVVMPFDEQEYAEKILFLIQNPIKLKEMSKSAIEKAKEFEISNIVDKWMNLFNEVEQIKK